MIAAGEIHRRLRRKGPHTVYRAPFRGVALIAFLTLFVGMAVAQRPDRPPVPDPAPEAEPSPPDAVVPGPEAPSIALTIIAGRPFVRVTLVHGETKIPAHLRLDIGRPIEMTLHPRTARLLGMNRESTVDVAFGDWTARDLAPDFGGDGDISYLTGEYATELSEIPVVGIAGSRAFGKHRLRLDLAGRRLTLLERRVDEPATEGAPNADAQPAAPTPYVTVPCNVRNGAWTVAMDVGNDAPILAAVSTMEADTWIDRAVAERLGHPSGDVAKAAIGAEGATIDVAGHVALRPGDAPGEFPGRPAALVGANFLDHFVATFDPFRSVLELERVRPAKKPVVERAIFAALAKRDGAAIEKWLDKHKAHRLAMEAGRTLLSLRIHEAPLDKERVEKALSVYAATTPAKRRTRMLLEFLQKMAAERDDVYAISRSKAIELAVQNARFDEDPDVIHKTRSELGARFLEDGKLKEAHRHLLSAAFGLPRDGMINLRLGRFWERKRSFKRAWSRYLMAAITPEAGAEGMDGLKRLAEETGDRSPYDAEAMERLLEGRIPGFGPASTYRAPDGKRPTRTVLAELFTGAHCKPCAAADLAFEGIDAHFRDAEVVVLQHHLPVPAVEPLVVPAAITRARALKIRGTPSVVVDGFERVNRLGGQASKAAERFATLRMVLERRLESSTPWRLGVDGTLDKGVVRMTATIEGPADRTVTLRAYVAERTMLFPGGNGIVLHRWVTRHDLSDGGVAVAATDGARTIERSVSLDDILDIVDEHLDGVEDRTNQPFAMRPDRVAERQLAVIAFLEDASGRVVQAARWECAPREDE